MARHTSITDPDHLQRKYPTLASAAAAAAAQQGVSFDAAYRFVEARTGDFGAGMVVLALWLRTDGEEPTFLRAEALLSAYGEVSGAYAQHVQTPDDIFAAALAPAE